MGDIPTYIIVSGREQVKKCVFDNLSPHEENNLNNLREMQYIADMSKKKIKSL